MKLLDTTILVDHLRGQPLATQLLAGLIEGGDPLLASELTRFELLAVARPKDLPGIERLSESLDWVPLTGAISRRAAGIAREVDPHGDGIGATDYLIASTALELGAELLTTDVRRFPMLQGLVPAYVSSGGR